MHVKKIAGIVVASSTEVSVVILSAEDDCTFAVVSSDTLKTGTGDRSVAYSQVADDLRDCLKLAKVDSVCIKASELSRAGMKLGHLQAAELRGVVMATASIALAGKPVHCLTKSSISRKGDQKVDEILKDDEWWEERNLGDMKKGSREAAFMAISASEL